MKVECIQLRRWPGWPWWSIVLPALWLALGGVTLVLSARTGRPVRLCLLKRFTGYPCPTCGFTRGVLSFLQGHLLQGWLCNPLLFSFLGVLMTAVGIRVLFGRSLDVHVTPRERTAAWLAALLLALVNWLYVILYVG